MKKLIFAFALILAFGGISASHVSASVICDNPDHPIWSLDNSTKEVCISDTTWRASLALQANQSDLKDVVKVIRGQHVMTTFGEDSCPSWFPMDCVLKKALFMNYL